MGKSLGVEVSADLGEDVGQVTGNLIAALWCK